MFLALLASVALFVPPASWQASKPPGLSEHTQIGFVGKGSTEFIPSLLLGTEEVDCNLKAYVKAVKGVHLSEPGNEWQDLGKIALKAGTGHLVKVTSKSQWGELVFLQTLFVKDRIAYILTAGVLKDDLPSLHSEILTAMRSFDIQPDLWSAVPDATLRSELVAAFEGLQNTENREAQWKELQALIQKETPQLGGYWQYLALKSVQEKLYPKEKL